MFCLPIIDRYCFNHKKFLKDENAAENKWILIDSYNAGRSFIIHWRDDWIILKIALMLKTDRVIHFSIRPSLDGTYYGMALSVRSSVRPFVRPYDC